MGVKKENEVLVSIPLATIILLAFSIPSYGPEAAFLSLCEPLLQTQQTILPNGCTWCVDS